MSLHLENLQFLETNAADLYRKVTAEEPLFPALKITEQDGTVKAGKGDISCYLHSSYSVEQEFKWLLKSWRAETEAAVLFGGGLFDMLPYILSRFKNLKKLIFVEPTLQIFNYFLHNKNFVDTFRQTKGVQLVFVINFDEATAIRDVSQTLRGSKVINMASLISYRILFNEYYNEFSERLAKALETTSLILFNDWLNKKLWLTEVIRNFRVAALPAESLASVIRGKPVILVGGGPSLAKNMHLLRKAQDKAIIIACGKAVQILNRAKIRPHFNAGLDSLDVNYYDNLVFPDVPLIFASQMSSAMVARYSGEKFHMIMEGDPINVYIYRQAKQRDMVFAVGSSIINTMYDFAARLGCSEVIFIGQDMCFYDDKIYADANEESGSKAFSSTLKMRKDIYGNDVYTATAYYSIQWALKREKERYMDLPIINATEGGLGIWGAENKYLADVLSRLSSLGQPLQNEINSMIMAASDHDRISSLECWDSIHCSEKVLEMIKIADEMIARLENLGNMYRYKAKSIRITKEMEKIERMFSKLDNNDFYSAIIYPYLGSVFTVFDGYEPHWAEKNIEVRLAGFIKKYLGKLTEIKKYCQLIEEESCLVRAIEANKG